MPKLVSKKGQENRNSIILYLNPKIDVQESCHLLSYLNQTFLLQFLGYLCFSYQYLVLCEPSETVGQQGILSTCKNQFAGSEKCVSLPV